MTRINLIDVKYLTDQHLMAEYRELPMVAGSLRRSLKSKKGLPKIPGNYTLNKGHVTFFYNKGLFLKRRYEKIVEELLIRGYKLQDERPVDFETFKENGLYNDWTCNYKDFIINRKRITEKLTIKFGWYRYYNQKLPEISKDWQNKLLIPTKIHTH